MNYSFTNNRLVESSFIIEEYFPVIIEYSSEELNNLFVEFNYQDTDMFELSLNPDTKRLKRFSLTLCNHFSFVEDTLTLPAYVEGDITIDTQEATECDSFHVDVYCDAVLITISNSAPSKYIKCGHIIFGFTSSEELASVHIVQLTPTEISHVRKELTN